MLAHRTTSVAALLVVVTLCGATSRSVNISSMWFLPQEGFPVFYRYFKDRITWFEADAVCQFHHANLVTVDTSVQYDATRAYLKELDIATNVWIGLKRQAASESFAWTDYKKLDPNRGYWQEQIPKTGSPLCAATDPAADFRWHTLNCGGPEVASFICELPVPPWARKEDGCLLTSLPSLTVIYLPEQGAVELASDCGLDGTRRIACKGQANREEMMRQLSCDHETTSSDDSTSPGSATPEVTISSTSARVSQSNESPTGTTGQEEHESPTGTTGQEENESPTGTTGHEHEPPTRHRRDTDLLTASVTTAVSEEGQLSSVASTVTATSEDSDTASPPPESSTIDKQTTSQEPQLSTTSTMTEEVTDTSTSNLEEGFIQVRELEVIAENNTEKNVEMEFTSSSTSTEQVTASPEQSSQAANSSTTTTTAATTTTTTTMTSTELPSMATVKEPSSEKNTSESVSDEVTASTTEATTATSTSMSSAKINTNNTETADFISAIREEMVNFSVAATIQKSDEIKSREEAEEERLKEEERREEERRFKEEEESRRRQFLPTPLRSLPEVKTSRPPTPEEYEEPEEVMEPEPEAPVRPNRGRRLTRPQPHSFYPYFLNRVLG